MPGNPQKSFIAALPATRFASLGRIESIGVTLALCVAALALFHTSLHYHPAPLATSESLSDIATYERIVERMRHGADYYRAAHAELVTGGYNTQSVFNWRPPALAWLISRLPSLAWAMAALWFVAAASAIGTFIWTKRAAGIGIAIAAVGALAINLVNCATPRVVLFTDVTAGALILASTVAYSLELPAIGFGVALLALFMRELVAPYVLICIFFAWRARRYPELWAWLAGLAAFGVYFFWHYRMVQAQIGAPHPESVGGWISFGGLNFILATADFNGLMLAKPYWVTALILPLGVFGLAAWRSAGAARGALTVGAYLCLFAVVGQPFDEYWGALYTPLMMIGLAFVPAGLRDLIAGLRRGARAAEALF